MTHRGDSDWHGWPLQEIVEQVAQKHYERLRARSSQPTPEWVDVTANLKRQLMDAVLPTVTDMLDVVNGMDHPLVSEVQDAFARLQLAYDNRAHGAVAQDQCLRRIREAVDRYTTKEDA